MEKLKLVYDIEALPKGLDPGNMTKIWEQHNLVYWDSSKGTRPRIYGVDGELAPKIVDTNGKELDLAKYTEEFAMKEFWDKELHNCKNSPIYFFKNYGTTVWPHKDEDMTAYLASIGVEKIEADDADEAKKLWEEQKETVRKATAKYTIEFLKERKSVIDLMKETYNTEVYALEKLVSDKVRLFDSNNQPLEPKKQVANLSDKIRKVLPVHPKYSEKYRTKKGKWDTPMLFVTDYKVLLQIFYDVLDAKGEWDKELDSSTSDITGA